MRKIKEAHIQSGSILQVEFVCPNCGRRLAWATPKCVMRCPDCKTWVSDKNRVKDNPIYLPLNSEQTTLFAI